MTKEEFSIVSERFLNACQGKSEADIISLYAKNEQFRSDYEAVEKRLIEIMEPLVKEIFEVVRKVVTSVVSAVQSNPEALRYIQGNALRNSYHLGA